MLTSIFLTKILSLAGVINFTGIITNRINKALQASLNFIGDLATQYIPGMVQKALSGAISFAGTVTEISTYKKILSGALAFTGGIVSGFESAISGVVNFTGHVYKKLIISIGAFLDNRNLKR